MTTPVPQTDQTRKLRIILIAGALGLVGFFLEVGPVGNAFSLIWGGPPVVAALSFELAALGFLAYLALGAAAAVGLHLGEEEPVLKEREGAEPEEEPGVGPLKPPAPDEEAVGVRSRVRPELHQMRMLFTALGGYILLKMVSLFLMWPAASAYGDAGVLVRAFIFGLYFTALGWFLLWQFLRWYAIEKKWGRLQDELVGGNVSRVIAVVLLVKPINFLYVTLFTPAQPSLALTLAALPIYLMLVAAAIILWLARPETLRRILAALGITAALLVLFTLLYAALESRLAG